MHSIKREDLLKAFAPAKVLENQPIKDAVEQVKSFIYKDFTFRTEKGIKKEAIQPSIDNAIETVRDYILQTPNEENQDSFDEKHKTWCEEFRTNCAEFQRLRWQSTESYQHGIQVFLLLPRCRRLRMRI